MSLVSFSVNYGPISLYQIYEFLYMYFFTKNFWDKAYVNDKSLNKTSLVFFKT